MKMPRWTVDEIMALDPCGWDEPDNGRHYCRAHVERLFDGRERITLLEALDLDIPDRDKVWLGCRQYIAPWRVVLEKLFSTDHNDGDTRQRTHPRPG